MRWIGLVARLVVGGVWIAAGVLKIGDPTENVRAVRAYDLLPERLVQLVGHGLPVLEIVIGTALVIGLATRWTALVSALMLAAFIGGIASAWARGLSIECGCFGGGGPTPDGSSNYAWEIARDVGLLALAAFLVWRPRTPYAVDDRVLPVVPPAPAESAPAAGGGRHGERTRASQRAAAVVRAQRLAEQRKHNTVVTLGVVVALMAVVGVGTAIQSTRDVTGATAAAQPANTVETYAFAYGAQRPEVVVDVYEDFICPYCGQFERASRPVVDRYAEDGVQFRYHVLGFLDRASTDRYSSRAANALAAVLDTSGPEVAKKFHDELFARQPQEGTAGLSDSELVSLAVRAGAPEAPVQAAVDDDRYATWVANANDAASKSGVNATPTVLVDGQKLAGDSIAQMVANLEQQLGAKIAG